MPDEAFLLALVTYTADRQRLAVRPNAEGGFQINHVDAAQVLSDFNASYQPAPTSEPAAA